MKIKCDRCNGTGLIPMKLVDMNGKPMDDVFFDCYKCNKKGYLDWIEQIVPNKEVDFLTTSVQE